jgi:hypothetical protein
MKSTGIHFRRIKRLKKGNGFPLINDKELSKQSRPPLTAQKFRAASDPEKEPIMVAGRVFCVTYCKNESSLFDVENSKQIEDKNLKAPFLLHCNLTHCKFVGWHDVGGNRSILTGNGIPR